MIPVAFSEPWERTNLDNCRVITYDGHLNSCVVDMMQSDRRKFETIMHYLVQKF